MPDRPDLERITDQLNIYGPAVVTQVDIRALLSYALALERERDAYRSAANSEHQRFLTAEHGRLALERERDAWKEEAREMTANRDWWRDKYEALARDLAAARGAIQYALDHAVDMADEYKDRFLNALEPFDTGVGVAAQLAALERELGASRAAANAAAAFRAADKARRAYLARGCIAPDPTETWVTARNEFRRTADAWAALGPQGATGDGE